MKKFASILKECVNFDGDESDSSLTIKQIIPGLVLILVIDLISVSGLWASIAGWQRIINISVFFLPWFTLLVLKRSPRTYGYHAGRAVAWYGWGMLAGGIWRGLSMYANYTFLGDYGTPESMGLFLLSSILIIPIGEETFYRGYLGRTLSGRLGLWPGIIIQSALFTFFPGHWIQGWPAILSIFGFGILSGWLVEKTGSIWSAVGEHGFANVLPFVVLWLAHGI